VSRIRGTRRIREDTRDAAPARLRRLSGERRTNDPLTVLVQKQLQRLPGILRTLSPDSRFTFLNTAVGAALSGADYGLKAEPVRKRLMEPGN
jgi:hypothetical protein